MQDTTKNPECIIEKIVPIEIEKLTIFCRLSDRNKEKPIIFKYNRLTHFACPYFYR